MSFAAVAGFLSAYGGAIAAAAAVAGAGAGAASAAQSASAQRQQAKYQAAVATANQKIANWQAEDAVNRGAKQEQQQRLKMAGLKGTQRTVMAAHGLDLGEGSPLDILTGTDLITAQDAATIRTNAARDAWGYRTQGMNYQAQAGMATMAGDQAMAAMPLNVAGTLLNGASQVADRWAQYKK
jgi:hypothetical protein